jgi:hypothetical protein
MATVYRRITKMYGHHPAHLLAYIVSFALVGYTARSMFAHQTVRVLIWFVGAAVAHDLLLLPLYALANAILTAVWRRGRHVQPVAWLNYVRFPSAISATLLLIYLPEITRQRTAQLRDSGLSNHPYLGHWLIVTAVLYAVSAVVYALRVAQVVRRGHAVVASQG